MGISFWQILVIAILALLLFGRGRISDLMGDVAKGIKSFRKGLSEDEDKAILEDEKGKAESAMDITPEKQPQDK